MTINVQRVLLAAGSILGLTINKILKTPSCVAIAPVCCCVFLLYQGAAWAGSVSFDGFVRTILSIQEQGQAGSRALSDLIEEEYLAPVPSKHYIVIGASYFDVFGGAWLIDLDDYLGVSPEGKPSGGQWVTLYFQVRAAAGLALPVRLGFLRRTGIDLTLTDGSDERAADPVLGIELFLGAKGRVIIEVKELSLLEDDKLPLQPNWDNIELNFGGELGSATFTVGPFEVKKDYLNRELSKALVPVAGQLLEAADFAALLGRALQGSLASQSLDASVEQLWRALSGTPDDGFANVSPGQLPDFRLRRVLLDNSGGVAVGRPMQVTVEMDNIGGSTGCGYLKAVLDPGGDSARLLYGPEGPICLPAGSLHRATFGVPAFTAPGAHRLEVQAFSITPMESSTWNNRAELGITAVATLPPRAHVDSVVVSPGPAPAVAGREKVTLQGSGEDLDDIGGAPSIVGYRWTSDLGTTDGKVQLYPSEVGAFGPDAAFRMAASELRVGTHHISLQVKDNDGEVSEFAREVLTVLPPDSGPPPSGELFAGTVESPIYVGNSARFSISYRSLGGTSPSEHWVVINRDRWSLFEGSGDVKVGKNYFFDKTFNQESTANKFHFEFVVAGKTVRFPGGGELDGPIVQTPGGGEDVLANGSVTPPSGDPSTVFTFKVTYRNSQDIPPTSRMLALFIDDAGQGINVSRTVPNNENWAQGVEFATEASGFGPGRHTFRFSAAVGGTTHNVQWPPQGQPPGSFFVGQANLLAVSVSPVDKDNSPVSRYNEGDPAWLRVEVTDSAGQPQDATVRFIRANDGVFLYRSDLAEDPNALRILGKGTYLFHDYNRPGLPRGVQTYTFEVSEAGFPNTLEQKDLLVGLEEEPGPVHVKNLAALPIRFVPGNGPVHFSYELDRDAFVLVRVLNDRGGEIQTLAGPNATRTAGVHTETWSGTDAAGSTVPQGEYTVAVWARLDLATSGDEILYSPIEFATQGTSASEIRESDDVLYDPLNNEVLVAGYAWDANYKVARYAPSGSFKGNLTPGAPQFSRPVALAEDANGLVYVEDNMGRIYKYDNTSRTSLGLLWETHSQMREAALAIGGARYLYAFQNASVPRQVLRFGLDGSAGRAVDMPDPSNGVAEGMAVDRSGDVWVIYTNPSHLGRIYHYGEDLALLGSVDSGLRQRGLDLDIKNGYLLYVMSRLENTIRIYDILNRIWLPDCHPNLGGSNGGQVSGIAAAENGFTFVCADALSYNVVRTVTRLRDRLSADFQTLTVRTRQPGELNQPPETTVIGPGGQTINGDEVSIMLDATDDATPPEQIKFSWNLNGRGWSQYSPERVVTLVGIGRGVNMFQARAMDNEGAVDLTPAVLTFTGVVDHFPDTPELLSPSGGLETQSATPLLIASPFSDPDPASYLAAARFDVRSDGGDYGKPAWTSGELRPGVTAVHIPAGKLQAGTRYWWRVQYRDDTGLWSAWSAETAFVAAALQPSLVIQRILRTGPNVTIEWTDREAGRVYTVESAETLPSGWRPVPPTAQWPISSTDWTWTVPAGTKALFYRVRADQPGGSPNPDPANLASIPAGMFTMGSPASEQDRQGVESPQTVVTLTREFWMGKYEVTQAEYLAVMGSNPSAFTGDLNRPVEQVSWNDATNYCAKLTARELSSGRLPPGYAYRLPTEAEWEYAARAGTTTRFTFGDDPGYTQLADYAWYWDNGGHTNHPAGPKQPNPWGLYHMYGRVWEWCSDWYGTYPGGSVTDPNGPGSGAVRVLRGGSWYAGGQSCRSATRYFSTPDRLNDDVGFRVVLAAVP